MPHPDDELLSALLDGEAPSGGVAHVAGCGECQLRLEDLRRAAAFVAAAVTPQPGHLREASLAVAMRAADEPLRVAAITSLGRRLPNRTRARATANRRTNGLSAAAVLVVALTVGGMAISQLGRSDTPRGSATRDFASDAALDQSGKGAAAGSADDSLANESQASAASGGSRAGQYEAGDIGARADIGSVISQAQTDLGQPADARSQRTASEPSPCPYQTDETPLWQATLRFNAEDAVAHVVETQEGYLMQILRRAGCSLLASQVFAPTSPR